MKKNSAFLISALLVLMALISSCSKSSDNTTDPRTQFVGKWIGTRTFTFPQYPVLNKTVGDTLIITLVTGSSSQISISSSGYTETASVSGNTYTYNQYQTNATYNNISYAFTVNGSATISGNTLNGSGTFSVTWTGGSATGTWANSLTKQ
jgi:hypothetical protein